MSGYSNTATGVQALITNTSGIRNTASGANALLLNTTGSRNTAIGEDALRSNTGSFNTASGQYALRNNSTGNRNVALGYRAGYSATTGDDNIFIGNEGMAGDAAKIKIGTSGTHTKTYVAGIRGITTGAMDAIAVLIDSTGQLGTVSSSRRYKEEIEDMDDASTSLLELRPVTFRLSI